MQKFREKTVTLQRDFQARSDGSVTRAEILIENYLWNHENRKFKEILEKYGLKEYVNWNYYVGDFDAVVIYVRIEDIDLMQEMLEEIVRTSRKYEEEAEKEAIAREEALKGPREKLKRAIENLQNLDADPDTTTECNLDTAGGLKS